MSSPTNVEEFEMYLAACNPEERAEAEAALAWVVARGKAAGLPGFGRTGAIDLAMAVMRWMAMIERRKV
ncbi:MAG TPA: hypothetical protein PKD23_06800 [Bellilinea sp.]|nr:hypothetical protein [Bellilinea sp.]